MVRFVSASPTRLDVGFFSFFGRVGVPQLAFFFFFSEEVVPYVGVDLACPREEASSGFSRVTIMNQNICSVYTYLNP